MEESPEAVVDDLSMRHVEDALECAAKESEQQNLTVKLADLGNACWCVQRLVSSACVHAEARLPACVRSFVHCSGGMASIPVSCA